MKCIEPDFPTIPIPDLRLQIPVAVRQTKTNTIPNSRDPHHVGHPPIARDWSFLGKTNVNLNFVNDLRKLCTKLNSEVPSFSIADLVEWIIGKGDALSETVERQFQEEQRRRRLEEEEQLRLQSEESAGMQTNPTPPWVMAEMFIGGGRSARGARI